MRVIKGEEGSEQPGEDGSKGQKSKNNTLRSSLLYNTILTIPFESTILAPIPAR
jgi:hypothetical protein